MELIDKDLCSIQEVRNLIKKAKDAQVELSTFSQEKIDSICKAIYEAGMNNAVTLGKMANEETGFGIPQHKTIKNQFASSSVYEYIKDIKTVGIIKEEKEMGIMEIAVPMGVIAALIPSTNPTSTVIYKTLISIKSGNSIVFSPHPSGKNCILETVKVLNEAAIKAGLPKGAIGCMTTLTKESTEELMAHKDIALILATGGTAMVKAAYSSGNPAIGVGPGNGPAYIEKSANIKLAVKRILDSKCFDNGTICASEQSIVTEKSIADEVVEELKRNKAYFLNDEEKKKVSSILMRGNGTMNPAIVGKSANYVARLAGITVPTDTSVLIGFETEVGHKFPFSKEKLCPVLGFYIRDNWEMACELCIKILNHEGAGHTMMIHSENEEIIREFALKKPVSRLLVNTPGALGGIGGTTNLIPSLTLGCGAVGGSSTSDNIGPLNLINIRRVGLGMREIEDLSFGNKKEREICSEDLIEDICKKVIESLKQR